MSMIFIIMSYLLQIGKKLEFNTYNDDDLNMSLNYILSIDNIKLNEYHVDDYEIYLHVINKLIHIFEKREEFENCFSLLNKKNNAIKLKKK